MNTQPEIAAVINRATAVPSFLYLFGLLLLLVLIIAPLEKLFPASKQRVLGYRGWRLDLVYWFITPTVTKVVTNFILAVVLIGLFYLQQKSVSSSMISGFGPVAEQPQWLQAIEIIVLADFIDYWTHRMFHTSRLWRIHAVHHSPEEMSWISSSRVHPLNDLVTRFCQVIPLALVGFSGTAIVAVIPIIFLYVIFLHSNLSWNFGPFKRVLVSPAYHRWHHTSDAEGIDKNFAGIFPIWDLLFGTYHCPDRLPKKYGVAKEKIPETFLGQLLYPFQRQQIAEADNVEEKQLEVSP